MSALGRRYAKALLDLAREQGKIDEVLRDVGALSDAWKSSQELRDIVQNPVIPRPALKASVDAVMEKLGSSSIGRFSATFTFTRTWGNFCHPPESSDTGPSR